MQVGGTVYKSRVSMHWIITRAICSCLFRSDTLLFVIFKVFGTKKYGDFGISLVWISFCDNIVFAIHGVLDFAKTKDRDIELVEGEERGLIAIHKPWNPQAFKKSKEKVTRSLWVKQSSVAVGQGGTNSNFTICMDFLCVYTDETIRYYTTALMVCLPSSTTDWLYI